jgi:hypothetical protein
MQSIFQFKSRIPWWLSGVSLFIISQSFFQGQLYFEMIQSSGWSGMWFFWAGILGSFIIPLLFAPLWQKLQLPNDNHFYLTRFPGKGGQFLFHFRRIYVGFLVCSFLMALSLITYSNLLCNFTGLPLNATFVLVGIALMIMMWFNTLEFQVKWDFIIMVLYFILILSLIFWIIIPLKSNTTSVHWRDLFPHDSSGWNLWFFYLGFQWWATQQMDGGSMETSRFTGVNQEREARKSALTAALASALSSVIIAITAFVLVKNHAASFWSGVLLMIPENAKIFVFVLLTGMMAAQILALSNWGDSLIVDSRHPNNTLSKTIVLILVVCAIFIAIQNQSLIPLTQYLFAISAGVAPFYILRWIFPSIGPWTQIVVMIASLLGTLIYPWVSPPHFTLFHLHVEETRTLIIGCITISLGLISWWITPRFQPSENWISIIPSKKTFLFQLLLALVMGFVLLILMTTIVANVL